MECGTDAHLFNKLFATMKNSLTIVILLCSQLAVCQQSLKNPSTGYERVLEITYDNGGGEPGGSITLNIRPDSTFYFSNTQQGRAIKKLNAKTHIANWNKLTTKLNLAEFDKTPNGQQQREVDGIDTRIYIKTSKKTHTLIADQHIIKNYRSVDNLIKELQSQINQLDKKAAILKYR